MMLLARYEKKWESIPVTGAMKSGARRVAALVQLMSRVAASLGEQVDRSAVAAAEVFYESAAGGEAQLDSMLKGLGMGRDELRFWLASFHLAHKQLEYLTIQTVPVTDSTLKKMFDKGGHKYEGADFEEARVAFRSLVANRERQRVLANWLKEVLRTGRVAFSQQ